MSETAALLAHRYRPLATLGQGAMGRVWRVADTLDGDRELALKAIAVAGTITEDHRLRFKEEFRAMVRLRHPNTIAVHDYGLLDAATRYLTMEVVEGRDWGALAAEGPVAPADAYPLLIQLLEALAFIHARGYVHRDVKGANVMIGRVGGLDRVKLLDYGLMAPLGQIAGSGMVAGTPATLAPEVLRGGAIGEAADLYAVGCLAYQLLGGTLPFTGGLREVLRAHATEPPAPLPHLPEALSAWVMRLLAKDPRDRPAHASDAIAELAALAGVRAARTTPDQRRSYLVSGHVVGREAELATLNGALADARAGRGRAIYVAGPAGTGKSRLMREAVTHAKLADLVVLEATCKPGVGAPYKALVQAMRPLLALAAPGVLAKHRAALDRLFPAGPAPAPTDADKPWIHAAVLATVRDVAAHTPVVLAIDDLQWCDLRSLQAFHHLLRHLGGLPLLVLATVRDDEVPEQTPVWLGVAEGHAEPLRLADLPAEHLEALLAAMLGPMECPPGLARALHDATGGNPLFVTEVLRDLLDSGLVHRHDGRWRLPDEHLLPPLPARVEETILRRLARLSPGARALARVGAVLGRHLQRDMWRHVAGLGEDDFLDGLEELIERQFVARDGEGLHGLRFPHDRVREALYADLDPAERRALHGRCGLYLEATQGGRALNKLAHHFGRSDDAARGFRYGREAGDRARDAGMELTAVRHWVLAAEALEASDLPDRDALRRALRWDVGRSAYTAWPAAAIDALAALLADPATTPEEAAEAHALLAVAEGLAGRPARGLAIAAGPKLPTGAGREDHGLRLMASAPSLFAAGRFDELAAQAAEAIALLEGATEGPADGPARTALVAAHAFRNAVVYQGARPDDAARDRALALGAEGEGDELAIAVWHYHALWCAWTGRLAEGEAELAAHAGRSRRLADGFMLYLRPCLLMQAGAFDEAAALTAQALRHPAGPVDLSRHLLAALDGMARFARGDLDGADAALTETLARAEAGGMGLVEIQARLGLGRLAMARGAADAAAGQLEAVLALADAGPLRNPLHASIARRLLAGVHARAGRLPEARALLDAAEAPMREGPYENGLEQALIALARGDLPGDPVARRLAYLAAGDAFEAQGNRYRLYEVAGRLAALHDAPPPKPAESPEARWMFLRALPM